MNLLEKIGLLLVLFSLLLALYTGNLLGFSRDVRKKIEKLKLENGSKSKEELFYYKINETIRKFWPIATVTGIVIFTIGTML